MRMKTLIRKSLLTSLCRSPKAFGLRWKRGGRGDISTMILYMHFIVYNSGTSTGEWDLRSFSGPFLHHANLALTAEGQIGIF